MSSAFENEIETADAAGKKPSKKEQKKDKQKEEKKRRSRGADVGRTTFENPLDEEELNDDEGTAEGTALDHVNRQEDSEAPVPDEELEAAIFDAEALGADEREVRKGRDRWLYLAMLTGTGLLLPVYLVLSVFLVWMSTLVANAMSLLAAAVACTVTVVLYVGYTAARTSAESRLQLFSFLMTLAISMQLAAVIVFLLDRDNVLRDAFISSAAEIATHMCADLKDSSANLPVGAGLLPIEEICKCNEQAGPGNSTGTTIGECMRGGAAAADESWQVDKNQIGYGMFATLFIEVLLARIAWNMMVDLDVEAAKKGAKQKGGLLTGHLRGVILRGEDLRSEQQNTWHEKSSKKKAKRKGKFKRSQVISNRSVRLSLVSPDLPKGHEHYQQVAATEKVEDDDAPDWSYDFEDFTTYASSTALRLQVFDQIKKKKKPVLVGEATLRIHGKLIPDHEYVMDGAENSHLTVPLLWKDKKRTAIAAGHITLDLVYLPAPDLLGATTENITKSWYFEATVLLMVVLCMVVLAIQSPANPPSVVAFGALRVLEIFLATHMSVELAMELSVKVSSGKPWLKDPWFVLAVFVLACNWLSIMSPTLSVIDSVAADASSKPSERVVDAASNSATQLESGNIVGAIQYDDSESLEVWGTYADIDGSKTAVASRLIANFTSSGEQAVAPISYRVRRLLSVGRVFRIVRPIRTLRLISYVDIIVNVIRESLQLTLTVCVLIAFLLSVFALIGMSSFGGALQYECIGEANAPTFPQPECTEEQNYFTAQMGYTECPVECPLTLTCANEPNAHHWCAPLQGGFRQIGGDEFGFRDFDWFYRALVTMFVQTTGDGGLHTMPLALRDAGCTMYVGAWLISFVATIFLNLIALNLFLAVCCSVYSDCAVQAEELEMQRTQRKEAAAAALLLESDRLVVDGTAEEQLQEAKRLEAAKPYEQRVVEKQWGGSSGCADVRSTAQDMMLSPWFERITSALIIANTVAMAMVHDDMDANLHYILQVLESIFLLCYMLEAVIKLLGVGMGIYISSGANRFDLVVIIGSTLGFVATYFANELQEILGLDLAAVQSLRAVRLLRALQIVRFLSRQKALMQVLHTIFRAWKPLLVHTIFCLFSMCMFSIVGMQLLGGSLGPDATMQDYDTELSANFESFGRGLMSVFELTVGEDWSHSMWWYTRYARIGHGYPEPLIQLIFVLMYIWMNCILFSLYIAMLLDNFSVAEAEKIPTQKRMYDRRARRVARKLHDRQSELIDTLNESRAKGHAHSASVETWQVFAQEVRTTGTRDLDAAENKSLYIFRLDSEIRIGAAKVQASPIFGRMILILILFSCIALAAEGPPGGDLCIIGICIGKLISSINLFVLFAFILEASLKCIVHGFVLPSGPSVPYLATRMNRLDFVIILLCLMSYIPVLQLHGAFAKILRLGRVITPMLNLSKNPEIKLVFISFVRAGPDTAIILLPLVLMAIVFSILGVATFGQTLKGCVDTNDPLVMLPGDTFPFGNETLCKESDGHDWVSPLFNFDNSMIAIITLTTCLTDGAHGMMVSTTETATAAKAFWVMFHLCFTCFFLNLFIGVLSASFEKSSGSALMTLREKQWHAVIARQRTFMPVETNAEEHRPIQASKCCGRPTTPVWWYRFRSFCFTIASNEQLGQVFRVGIVANTLTLSMETFPAKPATMQIVSWMNWGFLALNACEVLTNLIGLGFKAYFANGWLTSDLILVCMSLLLKVSGIQSGIEVLRVIRVFRLFMLMSKLPALVSLIDTVIRCIRASLALILITSIIIYLFAVVGMNSFGVLPSREVLDRVGVPESGPESEQVLRDEDRIISHVCPHCSAVTDDTNFFTFFSAFRLLMQCAFGQGIGGFIGDLHYLGAGFFVPFVFFAAFFMIVVWVCINLMLVTVLSNFDKQTTEEATGEARIAPMDLDGYSLCWAALTIGVHGSPAIEASSPALLEHLSTKLQKESDEKGIEHVEPTTVNFEDGDPSLSGTLTIHIKRISVPPAAREAVPSTEALDRDMRPYCKVIAVGDKLTSSISLLTKSVELTGDETGFSSPPGSPRAGGDSSPRSPSAEGDRSPVNDDRSPISPKADGSKSPKSPRKRRRKKSKKNRNDEGVTLRMHVTAFHTHVDFDVRDSFKFTDDWIGGERVLLDDIRAAKDMSLNMELRTDMDAVRAMTSVRDSADETLSTGGPCVWQRYGRSAASAHGKTIDGLQDATSKWTNEHRKPSSPRRMDAGKTDSNGEQSGEYLRENPVEFDADDRKVPAAVDALDDELLEQATEDVEDEASNQKRHKDAAKAARKADKKRAKLAKRHVKHDKNKAKAQAKQRKKLEKERKKLEQELAGDSTQTDAAPIDAAVEEDEDEQTPHRFYRAGWRPNGARLLVTFEYQPKIAVQRTDTYMADYNTSYPHKESHSGVEGWLNVSTNGGTFVRRFCYVQQYPVPRLRMAVGDDRGQLAGTVGDLERIALRNVLELRSVEGVDIRSISASPGTSSSFALTATQVANDEYVQDSEAGIVAGTIVSAFGLRDTRTIETVPEPCCMIELQKSQRVEPRSAKLWVLVESAAKSSTANEPAPLYKLHVRGIGVDGWNGTQDGVGAYENEEALAQIFAEFGEVKDAMIRHRIATDGSNLQNTSWALLSFEDEAAIEKALAAPEIRAGNAPLKVTRFNEVQAAKSKGSMKLLSLGGKVEFEEAMVELVVTQQDDHHEAKLKITWASKSSQPPMILTLTGTDSVEVSPPIKGRGDRTYCVRVSCSGSQIVLDCNSGTELYGWIAALQAAAVIVPVESVQSSLSDSVVDSLSPEWQHDFEMKLFASTSAKFLVSVYDGSRRTSEATSKSRLAAFGKGLLRRGAGGGDDDELADPGLLVGRCEIAIGDSSEGGVIGPVLSGPSISSAEVTLHGKMTLSRVPKKVTAKLSGPEGEDAGTVELELHHIPIMAPEELLRRRSEAGEQLQKAFLVPEREENLYQFRASSGAIGRHWLLALRWCAEGCTGPFVPERPPAEQLGTAEMTRLVRNVALLDLPFNRVMLLLQHLYDLRVMGSHKPTLRRTMYTIFNLETHAWHRDPTGRASAAPKLNKKLGRTAGVYLHELRGLNFYATLERLSLLHYGKRRCLNFEEQVQEYQTESRHVALHMISTVLAMWVFKRIKRVSGVAWPWSEAWQRYPKTYQIAVEGCAVSRLRSLSVLMQEVKKRRPPLLDVQLPPHKTLLAQAAGGVVGAVADGVQGVEHAASSCCGLCKTEAPVPVDKSDPFHSFHLGTGEGSGTRTHEEEEEAHLQAIWEKLDEDGAENASFEPC